MKVILASESPRRIKLLKRIFRSFSVIPSRVNENQFLEKDPVSFALKAAEAKARAVAENYPDALVIAADTVVTIDGQILGKPANREEARRMLKSLSGRTHQVITAVVLYHKNEDKLLSASETSQVTFKLLTSEDIESYLDVNSYNDKAGAYAIQEVKSKFLEKLEGDYHNVVGLPLKRLRQLVHRFLERKAQIEISEFILPEITGLGRSEGRTFQVAGAYPGDLADISYEFSESPKIKARLLSILKPSPARQAARCPHFGQCGGCSLQDLKYSEQLSQKRQYLIQVFNEYFPATFRYLEIDSLLPSPAQYYYRNKMEFSFGQNNGHIFLGLKEKKPGRNRDKNKKVVRLEKCEISTPWAEKLFPLFSELAQQSGLPVFNLESKQGFFRHLVIREGKQTGDLMLL
ncbi:MAG: Maf family nucleotide pyrophosphatase, partial [Candidatus Saccharicenans sp.]